MARRNSRLSIIILVVAGLYFVGGYIYTKYVETPGIKKDFSITTGKIYEFAEPGKESTSTGTRYKYKVNGKEYERGSYEMGPCDGMGVHRIKIMEFDYPIVYHNEDPEKSRILISPKQFEEYGVPYQESMRSVYEKYWKCK